MGWTSYHLEKRGFPTFSGSVVRRGPAHWGSKQIGKFKATEALILHGDPALVTYSIQQDRRRPHSSQTKGLCICLVAGHLVKMASILA
jgi:hypothetical protein